MRTLVVVLALSISACCCKQSVEDELRAAEQEHQQLKFKVDATEQSNRAARDYAAELATGGTGAPVYSMYYSPADIVRMSGEILPYRIPARDFNSQLTGEIIIERIENLQLLAGNRLSCRMHLKGSGVRYTGNVPGFAKKRVESFQQGIAAGVITDLQVILTFDGNNVVKALSTATTAKLKRNSNPSDERQLLDQMNTKALRSPLRFEVGIEGTPAKLTRLLVTGNNIVLSYTP